MQPFLIRVLERCRQRRHYLAAVAEVSSNLSPLLMLADTLKAAPLLDSFFELVEVQGPFIHTGETGEAVTMLFVEFGELIQII